MQSSAEHQEQDNGVHEAAANGPTKPSNKDDDGGGGGVVYKKSSTERHWCSHDGIKFQSSNAFFKFWSNQFTQDVKPCIVRPGGTEKLKWLSKHLNMPDPVSALVRQFLVKDRIPSNAINVDQHALLFDKEYRQEIRNGPFVVFNGANRHSSYWAVIDSQNPNRVLITQTTHTSCTSVVCGGICYFDDDTGNVADRLTPFSTELFHYDSRNGSPSPRNVFLSGDTLCYIWSHRDVGVVKVDGWIMKEDNLVGKFNDLKQWYNLGKPEYNYFNCCTFKSQVLQERWLCTICKSTKQWFCLDLKSIRKGSDERETLYDCLEMPSSMDAVATIQSLANVPSYDITTRDGYPAKCIKCSKDTASGSIRISGGRLGCSSLGGLGKGVCEECCIRFSVSDQNWQCWKVVCRGGNDNNDPGDIRQCYKKVDETTDYQCSADHVPDSDLSFEILHDTTKKRKRGRGYQNEISVSVKYHKTTTSEGTS